MELEINRKEFYSDRCIGGFYISGQWYYYTLEDRDRQRQENGTIIPWTPDLKVPKETAIPYGRYQVVINWSNRFKRLMPQILDVPDFTGIRIHDGGLVAEPIDTEGCPLIGLQYDTKALTLLKSKEAFDNFFFQLDRAIKMGEEIWLEID